MFFRRLWIAICNPWLMIRYASVSHLEHFVYRLERPIKVGRNDPCPCGSGSKYKHCHYE